MALTTVLRGEILAMRKMQVNKDASREYTRTFVVTTGVPIADESTMVLPAGVPVCGDSHPEDGYARVVAVNQPLPAHPTRTQWFVVVHYSTKTPAGIHSLTYIDKLPCSLCGEIHPAHHACTPMKDSI